MNNLLKAAMPVAIALSLAGCHSNDNDDSGISDEMARMTLLSTNLEPLGDDFDYEGWLIVDGEAVSTGKFDIIEGETVPASFDLNRTQVNSAATFVLTIEPAMDDPAAPADTHILAGAITDPTANISITTDHGAALGTDFTSSAGSFILATPSNGNVTPTQGIWYLDNSSGSAVAGLTLPTLPAGWKYEGWVVGADGPISTGTFTDVAAADSDAGGPTAGPMGTPPFPGQDFINPAIDLVGLTSVISVEPSPDNATTPFSMKPLVTVIAASGNTLENKSADNLPSATVSFEF